MTRRLLYMLIVALAGIVACVIVAAASAEQCGCPAPPEPPTVPQPLPPVVPGGVRVWLVIVSK